LGIVSDVISTRTSGGDVRRGHAAARAIHEAFESYRDEFRAITRRARSRFERREWREAHADAVERLTLYRERIAPLLTLLPDLLGADAQNRAAWQQMKRRYAAVTADRPDPEIAWTFFSSVSRRVFSTVGVAGGIEFVGDDFDHLPPASELPVHTSYPCSGPVAPVIRWMLEDLGFGKLYRDVAGDADRVALAIGRHFQQHKLPQIQAFEMIPHVFYRNKGAYLVGRIRAGHENVPLALALQHPSEGITVDAVLLTSDDLSIVFGFTRSYFHAVIDHPHAIVKFLQTIMPLKRVDELYTSIGYNKHGKTELYRHLLRHLDTSDARFEVAEGDKGLVMTVFALPSLSLVFKVIRDRFGFPKNIGRQAVIDRYNFVFVRDRVGRLADAQEFEHLALPRERFDPRVLEELLHEAASSVRLEGDRIIVQHCYTERLVTPLNLFLKRSDPASARYAIVDYGNAIKDLAAANIFTGDMLLKNFGVTRHGRVIFYDYDELCLLTDCNFRHLPQAHSLEDEMAGEAWFYVGERDVFPEEFRPLVSLPGPLGDAFLSAHEDLLDIPFWQQMQDRQRAGEIVDVMPYREDRRLKRS
jgi:isocitrate dehydrogenase kinase/phosphatase